ncbi:MAG: tRNA (guanosine(46)-N7)-methyltransferase TrmB [Chlamydiae bacterium]|nr:tRNA (guanosine(46)-N7)-methyltransferase TrmB [Chlamydiota bacterium]
MKPKDLKRPFSFDERKPLLEDAVFYLPDYCDLDFELPWKRASIEFCSGNGDWIIAKALKQPDHFFVAVEMRFDRVRKIWAKMKNRGIENLLIVCGEAFSFLSRFVPDQAVDDVWINFPDPWPKRRHEKHRLMREDFLQQLARTVRGRVTLATDDATYMERSQQLLDAHPDFEGGRQEIEEYGGSYFDSLWREKGREIFYATYGRAAAQDQEYLQQPRAKVLCSEASAC